MELPRFFKGWAKPGPIPPGSQIDPPILPEAGESLDAISGFFRIFQYQDGHRFSTDDLLVAWYGTQACPSASRVLDLGSGIGSVGMVAAWRLPGAQFVTVEAQDISVRLARKSAEYNGLSVRYDIRQGDFRDPGVLAPEEKFDLVLGSPPYFPLETGILGDHPQKVACRFEVRGSIQNYCELASRHLEHGGVFATIFPLAQLERVNQAARDAGLLIIRSRDILFREGELPLLGVFLMMKSEHLPEKFQSLHFKEPPLCIRLRNGEVHPEYSTVKLSIGFPP
ncbi:MAG: methyltransferase [Methylotenera sp.]|nr:methyltransferase [Oligoflexia bacterium]